VVNIILRFSKLKLLLEVSEASGYVFFIHLLMQLLLNQLLALVAAGLVLLHQLELQLLELFLFFVKLLILDFLLSYVSLCCLLYSLGLLIRKSLEVSYFSLVVELSSRNFLPRLLYLLL